MTPVVAYVLTIIIFTKDGPVDLSKLFGDRQTCEITEGKVLTAARDDETVIGWTLVDECTKVTENNKI